MFGKQVVPATIMKLCVSLKFISDNRIIYRNINQKSILIELSAINHAGKIPLQDSQNQHRFMGFTKTEQVSVS